MILLVALALAVFVLPSPWGFVTVGAAVVVKAAEVWLWLRWSRRRTPASGIETLVGRRATTTAPCRPRGLLRVGGELWAAVCEVGADPGDEVEIVGVDADGLTLRVVPRRRLGGADHPLSR